MTRSGQLVYRTALGPVNLTAQLSAGKSKTTIASRALGGTAQFEYDNMKSLNVLLESGDWLLRLGQATTDTTLNMRPAASDKFSGVGLQYDNGTAIVMAEYITRRQTGGATFDSNSWYASAGWRFGALTPYVAISRYKPKGTLIVDKREDATDALGIRWDAMTNVALKAQVQNTKSTSLSLYNGTPAFNAAKPSVRVMSVAVDFVF